ncbi:MAG: transglycosylase SLT domain-containing protein [Burkholderiaceae bacterium]
MLKPPFHRLAWAAGLLILMSGPAVTASAAEAQASAEALLESRSTAAESLESPDRGAQQLEAGIRYENGEGVERDYRRAHQLYCQAASAEQPDALIRLGWMYANGSGVTRNDVIAATLFRRAANLGNDLASQLTMLFSAATQQMPECLGGPGDHLSANNDAAPGGPTAASRTRSLAPTPTVEAPAQFREGPAPIERRKIVQSVMQMAGQFRLDPRLVLAVIGTESGFDPNARSNKNAFGLMQLIPDTAERFAVKDILDPMQNIRGGMSYLRWLLAYYRGDVVLAVAAYNAGEGAVDKFKGVPPFSETLAYVQRIRAFYPFDYHPFDPSAAGPSAMLRIANDARATPAISKAPRM